MTTAKPVALVTGASSGIGKAASLALVEAGFEVVGTSRKASGVAQRDEVTFLDLDVTSEESVSAVVRRVIERFGRLDVLVNNAGTGAAGAAEESSVAQDQRVFDINFFGLIRMTKAVLPQMRAQASGRIINISSVLGLVPAPYTAGSTARRVSALRRFVPAWAFDRQIRKLNRLPAGGFDPHSHKARREARQSS